jgi:hypothetical protein
MNSTVNIPKNEQLMALASGLPALYQLIEKYTGGPIRTDFRQFVTVSKTELAEYLRSNPSLAEKQVMPEKKVLHLHDHPVLLHENEKWLVCWIEHGTKTNKVYFNDLAEAAANLLMAYW